MIGDRRTAALVGRDGSIDWWCWPSFDGTPIFWRLVDVADGASWRLRPSAESSAQRGYVPGTNVLETVHETASGTIRILDFISMAGPASRIVRAIEGLAGDVEIESHLEVSPFGQEPVRFAPVSYGTVARCGTVAVQALLPRGCIATTGSGHTSRLRIGAGTRQIFGLGAAETECDDAPPAADELWRELDSTLQHWRRWSGAIRYEGSHKEAVVRSALALSLLTHHPTGAIVAAATTSLPEVLGGERNWDYRYSWPRDGALTLDALMSLGHHGEAMSYWRWLENAVKPGEALRTVYSLDGNRAPAERAFDMAGYAGSRPVRLGNRAGEQLQLDVYGYVVAAAHRCQVSMGESHPGVERVVAQLADEAARRWRDPDSGLWERRDRTRQHLHGKLMCWIALDRALDLRRRGWLTEGSEDWGQAHRDIARTIEERGVDQETGAFMGLLDGGPPDAAALLVAKSGLIRGDDPRALATLAVVDRQLAEGPFVRRYLEPDGLSEREGAFFLCSFWRVEALVGAGRQLEAEEAFAEIVASASDLGLLSEQIDPSTRRLLGNYPQAFSHLGLIQAAITVERGRASHEEGEKAGT